MIKRQLFFLIISAALVTAAVLYCYNPFQLYFQNDDFLHIQLSKQHVLFQRNSFRPMCDISVMADVFLWNNYAAGYHITNLLLHAIASLLVYKLTLEIGAKYFENNSKSIAITTALFFFAYPCHSEAVFWILGRSAVLGTIFSLLFLLLYLKPKNKAALVFAPLLFVVALLTYESAWILPIVLWIVYILDTKARRNIAKPVMISILFGCYLLVRLLMIKEVVGDYEARNFLLANVQLLATNYAKLLFRSFMPPLYSNNFVLGCYIVFNLFVVVAFFKLPQKLKKQALLLYLFFMVSLLPYGSIGIDTSGTEAERFLYLPSVAWCIMITFVLLNAFQSSIVSPVLVLATSCMFVIVLFFNAGNYRLAGSITHQFVSQIGKLDKKEKLVIAGLPQSQHGALIFREGVDAALDMFAPEKINEVALCSVRANADFFKVNTYKVSERNMQPCSNCILEKFDNKRNAYMVFTDSALIVTW